MTWLTRAYVDERLERDEAVRERKGVGDHLEHLAEVLAVVEELVVALGVGELVDDEREEAAVEV